MNSVTWTNLDSQMAVHRKVLQHELGISEPACFKLATTIAADVRFLPSDIKLAIKSASPVPTSERLDELVAFQRWMDIAGRINNPFVRRAQVITQNYICFVYLSATCFSVLRKHAPQQSAAKICATFLTDNPVRAFRNAIAHSNWKYRSDFGGLIYWSRKGESKGEPLSQFEVDSQKLTFWQSLCRCLAYATYQNLD